MRFLLLSLGAPLWPWGVACIKRQQPATYQIQPLMIVQSLEIHLRVRSKCGLVVMQGGLFVLVEALPVSALPSFHTYSRKHCIFVKGSGTSCSIAKTPCGKARLKCCYYVRRKAGRTLWILMLIFTNTSNRFSKAVSIYRSFIV